MWPHRPVRAGCHLVTLALIAIGVIVVIARSCEPNKAATPFASLQNKAQTTCSRSTGLPAISTMPYHVGKVLAVRSNGNAIGHLLANGQLQNIMATSPEEVGTLICVGDIIMTEVETSSSGATAYRLSRYICVIDWETGDVIYKVTLKGSSPPAPTSKVDATAGDDPEYSILVDFIAHLPRNQRSAFRNKAERS